MLVKLKYLYAAIFTAYICSSSTYAFEWPVLDSSDPQKTAHKMIISSILGRPGDVYLGGQYKYNRFVIQGKGLDERQNSQLISRLPELRRFLNEGKKIRLSPLGTIEQVSQFSRNILYEISVNDTKLPFQFSLYNSSKLTGFKTFLIPELANNPIVPADERQSQQLIEGIAKVMVGHGLHKPGVTSHNAISTLIQRHKNHPVLSKAFAIIEGADLAIACDQKILLNTIRTYPHMLNMNDLFDLMRKDRALITQSAELFRPGEDPETSYLPFLDQLHALGNQGPLLGHTYKGRKGIDGAIIMIRHHPELLRGVVAEELKRLSGTDAINLRIALFYIALAKKHVAGEAFGPAHLSTFFKGDYFGNNPTVKDLLSQTSFYQDGCFWTPDNGYVKNSDSRKNVPSDFQGLDLVVENGRSLDNPQMVFSDCSGFAQQIAKQFHPQNARLQKRVLSYQLAAVYDALANERKGTSDRLYDLIGSNRRALNAYEAGKVTQYSQTIAQLKAVYEPVLNPLENMRPGDILVERSVNGSEGHVMIIVDQSPDDPTRITVVELTGFGNARGYRWRDLKLSNNTNGCFHRVLKIIQ